METWQKDHIRKNLLTLIQDTVCSSSFLASLFADGIVSDEEVQIMRAVSNRQEQAQLLYERIQTRKDSFNPLKQALKDTSQTGALAILDQCNSPNVPIPFKNCRSISYIRDLLLGRGCYGTRVFKGKYENRDVAVKRIYRDEVEMANVKEEVNFLTLLDSHKNVVRYFKMEVTEDFIFIALELCDVNLFDWVIQLPKTVKIDAMEVIKQTTEGVAHLHSNRVIHRDLKPTNILLVSRSVGDTQVKISDFGLSKRIPVGVSKFSGHTAGVGTAEWMAPEVAGGLNHQNNVAVGMSFASDVFSLGCIYYFVLSSGLHPFGEASRCQGNILDGKYHLGAKNITASDGRASGFINLISKMIAHNRRERPSISEILAWLPDVLIVSKNSVEDPVGQQNAIGKVTAAKGKLNYRHAVGENPGNVHIVSAMKSKLMLPKVDNQKGVQLQKIPGTVPPATTGMQKGKWENKEHKLHLAIGSGDMQAIQELIQSGADVNAKNRKNDAPLMTAALSKVDGKMTYDIVKYLIDHGADAFETDSEGRTFLHKLLLNTTISSPGFRAFAQYIVDKNMGSLLNIRDTTFGTTPFMLAAKNMELDMAAISLLRTKGVNVALVDKNGASYLSYAAEGSKNRKFLVELMKNGGIKHNKLAEAIQAMDVDSIKVLVRLGADMNEPNDYDLKTPLHLAAELRNKAFAINASKFLIEVGANVNARDKKKRIFLHLLVGERTAINPSQFDDLATYLISKGLSRLFNTPDMYFGTPFHEAVKGVEIQRSTLSLLKSNGVDFNAADRGGCSVLYWATMKNRTFRMISDLVDLGAIPHHVTTHKWSLLHQAAYNGDADVVKFFIDKGLLINAQDNKGKTPLHCAIQWASKENVLKIVQLLLQNGARSDIVDIYGKSPRHRFNVNRDKYSEAEKISTCFSLGPSC